MVEIVVSKQADEKTLILSKATLSAADQLGVSGADLAPILGVSESFISRMKQNKAVLSGKSFELAALFVRLFRGLDAITGNPETSRNWMRSENSVLHGLPIDLVKSVVGLTRVQAYVDSRRARN